MTANLKVARGDKTRSLTCPWNLYTELKVEDLKNMDVLDQRFKIVQLVKTRILNTINGDVIYRACYMAPIITR